MPKSICNRRANTLNKPHKPTPRARHIIGKRKNTHKNHHLICQPDSDFIHRQSYKNKNFLQDIAKITWHGVRLVENLAIE